MTRRTTAAKVGEIRLVSVYQPHSGHNAEEIEEYRGEIEEQIERSGPEEVLVVGGNHNAHVGGGEERETVRGRHGIGRTIEAGEELTNWCEENNMCIVGSFYPHRRRGAWFHRTLNRWYELDGFLMRCEQRHKHVKRMATIQEAAFSDRRPKMMELKTNVKKWRQAGRASRAPNLRHEKLKDNETAMRYKEKTAEEVRRAEIDGRLQDGSKLWETLTDIMVKCVKETCGTREKKIASPWLVDREDQLEEMRENISTLIERRNELQAYRATRARDRELTQLREDLKRARKLRKKHLRRWEREFWDSRIEECEQAYYSGDMGRMYRTLREIGAGNNKREQLTTTLTTTDFKKHFEDLSAQRYEREPHEIEAAMMEMKDLRMEESAREANIMVNEMPEEEEIEDALKEVKDNTTGRME